MLLQKHQQKESQSSSLTSSSFSCQSSREDYTSISHMNSSSDAYHSITSTNDTEKEDDSLSDYEKLRARNIERNNKRMVELGLMSNEEAKAANQKAWKKQTRDENSTNNITRRSKTSSSNNKLSRIGLKRERAKMSIDNGQMRTSRVSMGMPTRSRRTRSTH